MDAKYSYSDISFCIDDFVDRFRESPFEVKVSLQLYSELFQNATCCHLEHFKGKISVDTDFGYDDICLVSKHYIESYSLGYNPDSSSSNAFMAESVGNVLEGTEFAPPFLSLKKEGQKFDKGKPRWSLLPFRELRNVVEILTFGADKYAPGNWQKVDNATERYSDAALRHLTSWLSGEKKDPESGKSHLAHVACNILFLMWFENEGGHYGKNE